MGHVFKQNVVLLIFAGVLLIRGSPNFDHLNYGEESLGAGLSHRPDRWWQHRVAPSKGRGV